MSEAAEGVTAADATMAMHSAKLSRREHRQFVRTLEAQGAIALGKPVPSSANQLVKPAKSERKLVLFTLGLLVALIVVVVLVIESFVDGDTTAATTSLITLAGTGLGFIGGMVRKDEDAPPGENPPTRGPT